MKRFAIPSLIALAAALPASEAVIRSGGGYLASGPATTISQYDYGVIAYATDGTIDATLDADGRLRTDIASSTGAAQIYDNGSYRYVAGYSRSGSVNAWTITRYTAATMAKDTSWGTSGTATIVINAAKSHQGYGLAFTSDGKVIAAGAVWSSLFNVDNLAVVRLTSTGALDTTFGTAGVYNFLPSGTTDFDARQVAVLGSGKILVVGTDGTSGRVFRLTADGALDTTYATSGIATLAQTIGAASIASDGTTIIAGWTGTGPSVQRLASGGGVDATFGAGGVIGFTNPGAGTTTYTGYYPINISLDGSTIYVTGFVQSYVSSVRTDGNAFVWKMTASGTDGTFGTSGVATLDTGNSFERIDELIHDSGSLWVFGQAGTFNDTQQYLIGRITAAGAWDTTFNTTGYRLTQGGGGTVPTTGGGGGGTTGGGTGAASAGGGGGGGCGAGGLGGAAGAGILALASLRPRRRR